MRLVLYPFFSQQDKVLGKFRLGSDSGVRLYSYIAERAPEAGWSPLMVLPPHHQLADPDFQPPCGVIRSPHLSTSNLHRRIQWDPEWLLEIGGLADVLLTQHEFLAYPLRALYPDLVIGAECGILPTTAWPQTAGMFPLAWKAASFVHCNSRMLAQYVSSYNERAVVWEFGFHESIARTRPCERGVHVLFNARASETGYSNHELFVEAVRTLPWGVVMTDPTSYLRKHRTGIGVPPEPVPRDEYELLLHSSQVVVGLTANGYGGYAFREAIAAGCVPVALRVPEYEDLLGDDWPYYCTASPASVRDAIRRALVEGWPEQSAHVHRRVMQGSYGAAWGRARYDIEEVYSDSRNRGA